LGTDYKSAPAIVDTVLLQIQFFLKNHANRYADPKIATIVMNQARERTAIPERAAPLVHPLAICFP